jgi:hypothetical protein
MTGGIAAGTLTERFERFAYEAPPLPTTNRQGQPAPGHEDSDTTS